MYHKIDGKLVAIGECDITNSIMTSQYFIYDPDYSFLSFGVLGAIHEIEYMRNIQKNYNQNLIYYDLMDIALNCKKL